MKSLRLSEVAHPRYFSRLLFQPAYSNSTMPTYEYRCPECSNEFEKFQKMSDEPVAECPNCGARAERKLSGGAGFLFKGSGFYITDYRSDTYKKAASSEGGGDGKSSGSSTSESKSSGESSSSKSEGTGTSSKSKAE